MTTTDSTTADATPSAAPVDADARRVSALVDQLLADLDPSSTDPIEFRRAQYDRGLAWVDFPEGNGGLGLRASLHNF